MVCGKVEIWRNRVLSIHDRSQNQQGKKGGILARRRLHHHDTSHVIKSQPDAVYKRWPDPNSPHNLYSNTTTNIPIQDEASSQFYHHLDSLSCFPCASVKRTPFLLLYKKNNNSRWPVLVDRTVPVLGQRIAFVIIIAHARAVGSKLPYDSHQNEAYLGGKRIDHFIIWKKKGQKGRCRGYWESGLDPITNGMACLTTYIT